MLRVRGRAAVSADHQFAATLQGIGGEPRGVNDGLMDRLVIEYAGDGRDGLVKLLLDEIFNGGLLGAHTQSTG